MAWFGKKRDGNETEIEDEREFRPRRLRDLNPENRKKRTEPTKPWGKKERLIVLFVFLGTVFGSAFLSFSSRGFKLPNLPRLRFDFSNLLTLNPFREQTITIGKKQEMVPENEKNNRIKNLFQEKVKPLSGIYAFYLYDLADSNSFGINENETMQAASLIKLPVIYAFYKEVEKGNLKMDDNLRELIRLMCKKSDNNAFNQMRQKLGDELIQKYIDELGLTKTNLKENLTTPREISVFFQEFWRWDTKQKNEILDYLTDTIYEDFLPKGVPQDIKVAHKYGREKHVINDGGIILNNKPYILILMTNKIVENEAILVIPEISKLVFDSYSL